MKAVGLLKGFAAKSIFSPPGHARKGSLKNGSDYESLVVQNLSEREHQLFDAAEHGDYAAVSELIDKFGVNVQAADQYGFTALSHAALEGHYDICRLLLSRGALINGTHGLQTKGDASTPLHLACSTGNSPIVKLFLHGKHGQRVFLDAQTRATGPEGSGGGWTALHLAASIGDKTIVSSLLAAGANKTIRNDKLQTPADVAADSNTRRLIQEYVYRKRAQRRTSDNSSDGSEMAAAAGGGGGGEEKGKREPKPSIVRKRKDAPEGGEEEEGDDWKTHELVFIKDKLAHIGEEEEDQYAVTDPRKGKSSTKHQRHMDRISGAKSNERW
mmetsp:Transcript_39916/g.66687  ORF Transcript_39916/g.66687 Transcript_39916/m.66687 type:complete len:328 (+) Transcript_39916:126-1109(+)